MFSTLLSEILISNGCNDELSLNKKIKSCQENHLIVGTALQAEEAKKWENRVYLATYPRSGNHWIRYLIEEATGIATSSTYRDLDPLHLESVFPWGGYCCDHGYEGEARYPIQGESAVVKTHFPFIYLSWFERLPYTKAIRIIRHPIDTFYSLYVYEIKNSNAVPEFRMPQWDLRRFIRSWLQFQQYWDFAENVLTIRYEDLYNNPSSYLKLILEMIGYEVSEEAIERAVGKYPPREGLLKHLHHFSHEDLYIVQVELGSLMEQYGYTLDGY
jgi:hypothetical protein